MDDNANKIYIDANQNGDLTDDPQAAWDKIPKGDEKTSYDGNFTIPAAWKTGPGYYGVHMYRPKGSARTVLVANHLGPHGPDCHRLANLSRISL